jgi:hypothetical protein
LNGKRKLFSKPTGEIFRRKHLRRDEELSDNLEALSGLPFLKYVAGTRRRPPRSAMKGRFPAS